MKHIFQSEDGKVFTSESECAAYEAVIRDNETFEKSRFFSSYGTQKEKYDSFTGVIYIAPDELEKMRAYLRTRSRSIKGVSPSNIYCLYCMTFYPIEDQIKKEMNVIARAKKNIKDLKGIMLEVTETVKEELMKE